MKPAPFVLWQIRDWDLHFENNKSRERLSCSFCCIPNKQDGLGYGLLLREPDGPALYGAFHGVVLVASKQRIARDASDWSPSGRQGWLTETGLPLDRPLTADDLAIKTKFPTQIIQRMLEVSSQPSIGWIIRHNNLPACCPPAAREMPPKETKRREGKEENEIANSSGGGGVSDGGGAVIGAGRETLFILGECRTVLGTVEMSRRHRRWYNRAVDAPDLLNRVLAEVKMMVGANRVNTTPAQVAEDLWKRWGAKSSETPIGPR